MCVRVLDPSRKSVGEKKKKKLVLFYTSYCVQETGPKIGTMLKVVGASWYRTRISTYILAGACMLAFGAFFIADMERPVYNGTYCATAYWARNSGFRVEFWGQRNDLEAVPQGAVRDRKSVV